MVGWLAKIQKKIISRKLRECICVLKLVFEAGFLLMLMVPLGYCGIAGTGTLGVKTKCGLPVPGTLPHKGLGSDKLAKALRLSQKINFVS